MLKPWSRKEKILEGIYTVSNDKIYDQDGKIQKPLQPFTDEMLADAFGQHFLQYKTDDVQKAKLFLMQNKCTQGPKQSLEEYIIKFQTLLCRAEIDIDNISDQLEYVVHFYNGLNDELKSHGHNEHDSQKSFIFLENYWKFLRRHVQKTKAKDEVKKEIAEGQFKGQNKSTINSVLTPAKKEYSPEEKAAYKLKKQAIRDASAKRKSDTQISDVPNSNKKSKNNSHSQQFKNSTQRQPDVDMEGQFTADGLWFTGMKSLKPGEVWPRTVKLPTQPMKKKNAVHCNFTDAYKVLFPEISARVVNSVAAKAQEIFNAGDKQFRFCLLHNARDHGTLQCPTYRCLYPGKDNDGNNLPPQNPPPPPPGRNAY